MPLSKRRWGYLVLLLWFCTAVSIDHLFDLRGLMSRHHAGFLDPWFSIFNAAIGSFIAIASTIIWWRLNRKQSQTGKVHVS
jgi:hypothetical protein